MNYQGVKFMFIEIFIVMLLKFIIATPVSRVQMDIREEAETFKEGNRPSVPPWAQAHGLGKHRQIAVLPLKMKRSCSTSQSRR